MKDRKIISCEPLDKYYIKILTMMTSNTMGRAEQKEVEHSLWKRHVQRHGCVRERAASEDTVS